MFGPWHEYAAIHNKIIEFNRKFDQWIWPNSSIFLTVTKKKSTTFLRRMLKYMTDMISVNYSSIIHLYKTDWFPFTNVQFSLVHKFFMTHMSSKKQTPKRSMRNCSTSYPQPYYFDFPFHFRADFGKISFITTHSWIEYLNTLSNFLW